MPFKKARIAIPSFIVLVAVAAGGAQLWAEHQARVRVNETFAALPAGTTGHYDDLHYNLFTQTLRMSGLSVARAGQPQLAVQKVVLHHVSGNGTVETPYRTSTVTLVGIDVWRGAHHIKIGDASAKNVSILAPGIPAPAGTPRWLIAPENGTPVAVGSLLANTISDDQGMSVVALSLTDYQTGQLRQISLNHYTDSHGNTIENAAATAVDLDGLDRVFNPARYTPDAESWTAPRPLLGHLEIANLTTKGRQRDSHFDHLTLDTLTGRPFAAAPMPETVKTPAFARDAAAAIGIGNATVVNLTLQDSGTASTAIINHVALTGYSDGAVGRFAIGHVTVQEKGKTTASLGHFEFSGLNATALLHAPADASLSDLVATAQNGGLKLSSLAIAGLSAPLPNGGTVTLKDLKDSVTYGTPVQTDMSLNGLSIPAVATPDLEKLLQPLGIDPLVLSFSERGSYDEASGDTHLDASKLSAAGLGSISLSGQFTNLPRSLPANDDFAAALGQTGIGAFRISFSNESLVQRITAMMAKQAGKTPAEITDGARAAAAFFAAALVPGQADAGVQIANFLSDPKTLTLTAAPAAPVAVGSFTGADLHAAQAALNLHLSAN
ncbi:hypothetical protein ACELLULO517_08305 [Acidisoma cellulosilytica]|uniref:DUF945 domain-containing protein n=1 Tax=Acidisoma cellulosilyticum TaxID=2802395 RepID=A0A964E319_9PROT|nr:hypothetical protein [Acidisoma cellulosilyticum]MCB8880230.1 hypothetical protein [Acidisoma cellulosilyticum]